MNKVIIQVLVVLSVTLLSVSGAKQCYQCASAGDADCADKFKPRDSWKMDVSDNDSCMKTKTGGLVTRTGTPLCIAVKGVSWCCSGNLCNTASVVSPQMLMKCIGLLLVFLTIRRY
ncbi:unnamed protein product [Didymodactylos carnosus]|uniref:Protein quiver n=1 Tax=Didymodactylos carnosus TaxID=1234261 RepID=A0A814Q5U4_9BILA|nr:unnamed protein product [Didymodactylos carnosus]CAF3879054.1 unnamed protein product [Didymodactylos carnosus]